MKLSFSPREVIDIAIAIENNGESFYKAASEKVKDDDAKLLLRQLSGWEAEHSKYFAELKTRLSESELEGLFSEYEGSAEPLTKLIADSHVFVESEPVIHNLNLCRNSSEVLNIALKLEEKAIGFYQSILEVLIDKESKSSLEKIISEEEAHVCFLERFIRNLNQNNS